MLFPSSSSTLTHYLALRPSLSLSPILAANCNWPSCSPTARHCAVATGSRREVRAHTHNASSTQPQIRAVNLGARTRIRATKCKLFVFECEIVDSAMAFISVRRPQATPNNVNVGGDRRCRDAQLDGRRRESARRCTATTPSEPSRWPSLTRTVAQKPRRKLRLP